MKKIWIEIWSDENVYFEKPENWDDVDPYLDTFTQEQYEKWRCRQKFKPRKIVAEIIEDSERADESE